MNVGLGVGGGGWLAVSLNPKLIPIFPQVRESVFNIAIFVWATLKNQGVQLWSWSTAGHAILEAELM